MVTLPLHWQLLPWHPGNGKPRLEFDIINPPSQIGMRNAPDMPPRPIRSDELGKPACRRQAVHELTLRCEDKRAPWPITVRARGGPGTATCEDIFGAIHEAFQVPLTDAEVADMKRDRAFHEQCHRAFRRRCKLSMRLTEYEERKGYRRVDVLGENTWFSGMCQPVNPELGYYILKLRPRPASSPSE
jgi:hypothetical protein